MLIRNIKYSVKIYVEIPLKRLKFGTVCGKDETEAISKRKQELHSDVNTCIGGKKIGECERKLAIKTVEFSLYL